VREIISSFLSFISDEILDFTPSSPFAYLIYLLIVVIICLGIIFYFARQIPKEEKEEKRELTLNDLINIAKNPKSSKADLLSALMLFNEHFKVKDDVENSLEFFEKVLTHKHRQKVHFDYFHGNILPKNITFKDKLDELEKNALNSE